MDTHKIPSDNLVSFLYVLARNHVPMGVLEGIMMGHIENFKEDETVFSNNYLAEYAQDLAKRLKQGNRRGDKCS